MFASKNLMFGQQSGYQISRSVRLRSSASAYLNRTFGTPTNNNKWTYSGWFKRGTLDANVALFGNWETTQGANQVYFNTSNQLVFFQNNSSGTNVLNYVTTQVFRDPAAWYHIVISYDNTLATTALNIYVNSSSQITAFGTSSNTATQNGNYSWNKSGLAHYLAVGKNTANANFGYADGYFADINFIDGQALTSTSFGAFDAVTGVWNPKAYSGTYGTNGFYLNFKDPTSTTTIGYDYSGNSNNWTSNNISVTAGVTYDSMVDSPTNYGIDTGVGGSVRGNYATLNPIANGTAAYVKDGNLRINPSDGNFQPSLATIGVSSGKWYAECTITAVGSGAIVGIGQLPSTLVATNYLGNTATSWGYYGDGTNARLYNNSSFTSYGATYTTGAVIGVALDMDAGTLVFYRNGTSQGTAVTGLSGTYAIGASPAGAAGIADMNYGQRAFVYTAPSGYKALCTQNLPTATISNGANYMAATLWTGTGVGSRAITNTSNGVSFQPDWVWLKSRSATYSHQTNDSVRGATNGCLYTDLTNAVDANFGITSFDASGFTLGNTASLISSSFASQNGSGTTFVGWQWKGGGTAVSNTAGSITSSVSANTTAGFSILTYTGTGATATIGHGLGVAPSMIIVKKRSAAGAWKVYHTVLGNTKILEMNATDGAQTSSTYWNNTSPTSTLITVGSNGDINASSETYASYCFSAISGYSAFISYTGNGSGDGPFVYCGFRPRWLIIKRYDASGDPWWLVDSTRSPYNQTTLALRPSASNAEDNSGNANFDFLSNGFKARTSGGQNGNESGATYIVAAFAENPFTLARAR